MYLLDSNIKCIFFFSRLSTTLYIIDVLSFKNYQSIYDTEKRPALLLF